MGAPRDERAVVAECVITNWTMGDDKWAFDHDESIVELFKPFGGPKKFFEKWGDTIDAMSNHLIHIVTKEVPGTPIKV